MKRTRRRFRMRIADSVGALLALVIMTVLSMTGLGPVPALASVLNPGTGVWHLSPDTGTAVSGNYTLPGLQEPGSVAFEPDGATHITAGTDQDLFRMIGYVDARFRLVQMDLERRQAESTLAAAIGSSGLSSDTFELDLGLMRAARRDLAQMSPNDPTLVALTSYSQGVNAAIDQLEASHQLPATFKLLGYSPAQWTPLDSLAVQRLMTQTLSFSDTPLTFSYAAKALPASVFNSWYPVVSSNPQVPYDTGPYPRLPLSPLPVSADPGPSYGGSGVVGTAASAAPAAVPLGGRATAPLDGQAVQGTVVASDDFTQLERRLAKLPVNAMHYVGNSNAWAISGSKTASGMPILAGDPHLQLTLPSDWYQLEGTSPSYHFTGVTLPGLPVPIMGKTDSISWAVTNSQHPVTLYYLEQTSPSRPGQYYYKGAWHTMTTEKYVVNVKGGSPVTHTVSFTAQGPVLQEQGITAAVWWAGTLPSSNFDSMLQVLRATSFSQFRTALQGWVTPSLNFVYADNKGNIGAIDAGVAPQVPGHNIALPLPGNGSADVTGTIPYAAMPTAYNPPSGFIVTANNREVGANYPYEFSTSYNFADPGYRAEEIAEQLSEPVPQTPQMSEQLQASLTDSLAQGLVPNIVKAMAGQPMTAEQQSFLKLLSSWNEWMGTSNPQALFFQKYIVNLVYIVFEPWWKHYNVPSDPLQELAPDPSSGTFSSQLMYGDLDLWVNSDPDNQFFSLPNGTQRDATDVLRAAYTETIAKLTKAYGPDFAKWDYGKHNFRTFPSLLSVSGFDYGPIGAGGDSRTVSAGVPVTSPDATGGTVLVNGNNNNAPLNVMTTGASWRFVMNWGTGTATAILPGGDSEDPVSPWYSNGVALWLKGEELPLLEGAAAQKAATIRWRFTS
jgi:penicillin G amidase